MDNLPIRSEGGPPMTVEIYELDCDVLVDRGDTARCGEGQ
jgi:hypothetical protein